MGLDNSTTPTCNAASSASLGVGHARTGAIGIPAARGGRGGESLGTALDASGNRVAVGTAGSIRGSTICPAGWRIPSGRVGGPNTTTSNLFNEWRVLSESFQLGALFTDTASMTINQGINWAGAWQPAGVTGNVTWRGSFGAVSAGQVNAAGSALSRQSTSAFWWSSSLNSAAAASSTWIYNSLALPGTDNDSKALGLSVRCAL
jgi:uncharacterized protein (TIGR02145 family)